jgi:hypothetical protein
LRFGLLALEVPLDLAFQGHPSIVDTDLNMFRCIGQPLHKRRDSITRDRWTRALVHDRQTNLDVVRHAGNARHALGCILCPALLVVISNHTG